MPLELIKVLVKAFTHSVIAKKVNQLFQKGRSFAVTNAVKQTFNLVSRDNVGANWVCAGKLICGDAPKGIALE